jgi:hypothetical protein
MGSNAPTTVKGRERNTESDTARNVRVGDYNNVVSTGGSPKKMGDPRVTIGFNTYMVEFRAFRKWAIAI